MTDENPLAASHRLLWEGLPEPRKGPKPTLTLEQIVTTAIQTADADGIDALSMRKLATALGMSAMALYRYVPSKTELLNLMLDAVSGFSGDVPTTWRAVLETQALEGRRRFHAHRWLLQINWTRPVLGPKTIAEVEQTVAGLADLPFTDQEKLSAISAVDGYVTGMVRQEILYDVAAEDTGIGGDEFWELQLPLIEQLMATGDYPAMAALSEDSFGASWDETFTFGLTRLLDGIELEAQRRRG